MEEILRQTVLDLIAALRASATSASAHADELAEAARALGDDPGAAAFVSLAHRQRVEAVLLVARLSAMQADFDARFPHTQ